MVNCEVCDKGFKNNRGFHSHMEKHRRIEENRKEGIRKRSEKLLQEGYEKKSESKSVLNLLGAMTPPIPFHKVEIDMSPEGHLKISIKKELVTNEELEL